MKTPNPPISQKRAVPSSSTPMELDEEPNISALRKLLSSATDFSEPLTTGDYTLLKLGKRKDDHTNFYLLVRKSTTMAPIFKLQGSIEIMNTTPERAVLNRSQNIPTKIEQYIVKLNLESDSYATACSNIQAVETIFKEHPSALFEIAQSMKIRSSQETYAMNPVIPELYGLAKAQELYATKSVASPHPLSQKNPMAQFLPNPANPSTAALIYPRGFHLRSIIPTLDSKWIEVRDIESVEEKEANAFFYIVQHAYSGKIILKLEPIAVTIDMNAPDSPAKKARNALLI